MAEPAQDLDFLSIERFIGNLVEAQALKTAFDLGLIDRLKQQASCTLSNIKEGWRGDRPGLSLLIDLLAANQVVARSGDEIRLTRLFVDALRFRDLLEAKLEFASLVAPDLVHLFSALIVDPVGFMREARIFDLFGYHRALEWTSENFETTKRWMRFTTCLTRYEARACMVLHDFTRYTKILDIGGNSGELLLQLCKRCPDLSGTVFDLPVVCDVGKEHVLLEPEVGRITFQKGNALVDPLPAGFDAVIFKSMLHDWPDQEAAKLIERASGCLNPGGTLLIFERARFEVGGTVVPYSLIPMLLFFRSFRSPSYYQERLDESGFVDVEVQTIHLEMPFFLVTARLGGES